MLRAIRFRIPCVIFWVIGIGVGYVIRSIRGRYEAGRTYRQERVADCVRCSSICRLPSPRYVFPFVSTRERRRRNKPRNIPTARASERAFVRFVRWQRRLKWIYRRMDVRKRQRKFFAGDCICIARPIFVGFQRPRRQRKSPLRLRAISDSLSRAAFLRN